MKNQITEQNLKKELTKQKGITLIALVVTIIVLLILAGVTITLVLGENGIIAKAQRAQSATDEASAKEAVELAVGYVQAEAYTNNLNQEGIRAALQEELQKTDANATVSINGEGYTATYKGYEFEIDSNFNVTIKQPFNAAEWDKTAAPETCFQWGSDVEGESGYNAIVGYTSEIQNYEKVRIPSRCKSIETTVGNSPESAGRTFIQNIVTVELPETVTEIGTYAFGYGGDLCFKSMENINIPNSVTSIGACAFEGCTGLTNITIPDSVTSIGGSAFSECTGLTNITIPNSVTSIGSSAFYDCRNLKSVEILGNITRIETNTFHGCTNLTDITIPDSVIYVSNSYYTDAFMGTAWYDNQPDGVVYVGKVAYKYKGTMSDTSIEFKEGTKAIQIFLNDGITNILVPDSVVIITGGAFTSTAWYNNQPDGVVYAGKVAYKYKGTMPSNTSIKLKEGTKAIANEAFEDCTTLTNIKIPDSVISIGSRAFAGCIGLTNITIPLGVNFEEQISMDVFNGWTSSQTINCRATSQPSSWSSNWNAGCNANIVWGYTGD